MGVHRGLVRALEGLAPPGDDVVGALGHEQVLPLGSLDDDGHALPRAVCVVVGWFGWLVEWKPPARPTDTYTNR